MTQTLTAPTPRTADDSSPAACPDRCKPAIRITKAERHFQETPALRTLKYTLEIDGQESRHASFTRQKGFCEHVRCIFNLLGFDCQLKDIQFHKRPGLLHATVNDRKLIGRCTDNQAEKPCEKFASALTDLIRQLP